MKKKIVEELKKNPNEDLELIKAIEKIFKKRRDFICKIPPKNSAVILLLSGGLDSVTAWYLLMKKYQVHVYPVFFKTKRAWDQNKRSIKHYSQLFETNCSQYFHPVKYMADPRIAQKEISQKMFEKKEFLKNQADFILDLVADNFNGTEYFGQSTNFLISAYSYKKLLKARHNIDVKHFITGNLKTDGKAVKHQTLSSLRLSNLLLSFLSNDWQIQVFSIFAEPEINSWLSKKDILKLSQQYHLDLSRSWSCYKNGFFHCGECISCWQRKEHFQKGGIIDKTIYLDQIKNNSINTRYKTTKRIKDVISKILPTK